MKVYAVEYSINEDAYHISTLEEVISNNLTLIDRNISKDYMVIGVFRNYEAAQAFMFKHIPYNNSRRLAS